MKRKPRYTLEQHKALGRELFDMRERLCSLVVDLSGAYPATCRGYHYLHKAIDGLDLARCALDEELFKENPDGGHELVHVYYPHKDDARE